MFFGDGERAAGVRAMSTRMVQLVGGPKDGQRVEVEEWWMAYTVAVWDEELFRVDGPRAHDPTRPTYGTVSYAPAPANRDRWVAQE